MNSVVEEQQRQKIDLPTLLKSWISQGLVAVIKDEKIVKNQDGDLKVPLFDLKPSEYQVRCQNRIGSYASTHSTFNLIGSCNRNPNTQSHKDTKIYTLKLSTYELFFQNSSIKRVEILPLRIWLQSLILGTKCWICWIVTSKLSLLNLRDRGRSGYRRSGSSKRAWRQLTTCTRPHRLTQGLENQSQIPLWNDLGFP